MEVVQRNGRYHRVRGTHDVALSGLPQQAPEK
uniref:Uncharacterized protein n=1 Tax=Anguilla anguilla TaxID=7936 RepID=A0A0E9Q1W8_ANGAN